MLNWLCKIIGLKHDEQIDITISDDNVSDKETPNLETINYEEANAHIVTEKNKAEEEVRIKAEKKALEEAEMARIEAEKKALEEAELAHIEAEMTRMEEEEMDRIEAELAQTERIISEKVETKDIIDEQQVEVSNQHVLDDYPNKTSVSEIAMTI